MRATTNLFPFSFQQKKLFFFAIIFFFKLRLLLNHPVRRRARSMNRLFALMTFRVSGKRQFGFAGFACTNEPPASTVSWFPPECLEDRGLSSRGRPSLFHSRFRTFVDSLLRSVEESILEFHHKQMSRRKLALAFTPPSSIIELRSSIIELFRCHNLSPANTGEHQRTRRTPAGLRVSVLGITQYLLRILSMLRT